MTIKKMVLLFIIVAFTFNFSLFAKDKKKEKSKTDLADFSQWDMKVVDGNLVINDKGVTYNSSSQSVDKNGKRDYIVHDTKNSMNDIKNEVRKVSDKTSELSDLPVKAINATEKTNEILGTEWRFFGEKTDAGVSKINEAANIYNTIDSGVNLAKELINSDESNPVNGLKAIGDFGKNLSDVVPVVGDFVGAQFETMMNAADKVNEIQEVKKEYEKEYIKEFETPKENEINQKEEDYNSSRTKQLNEENNDPFTINDKNENILDEFNNNNPQDFNQNNLSNDVFFNTPPPSEITGNPEIDDGAFNDFNTDDASTDNYFNQNPVQKVNNNASPRPKPVKKRNSFWSGLGEVLLAVLQVTGEIAQGYVQANYQYNYALANNYANYNRINNYSTYCPPGYYWTLSGCQRYNQYNHAIPVNYAINNYSSNSIQNVPAHNCPPGWYWSGGKCHPEQIPSH